MIPTKRMTKKDLMSIIYVSIFVLIWGTFGSLVDFPLLKMDIYQAGSLGQFSTFALTAITCLIIAVKLFPTFISNRFN